MKRNAIKTVGTAIGALLCAVFAFLLICNLTIIIKGTVNPEKPPTVFGVTPMVVLSGSMSGNAEDHIEVGDLIFDIKPDIASLKEGNIVSFMDGKTVVTHRIVKLYTDSDGTKKVITKGDANNVEDPPISTDDIIGLYKARIPKLGDFALFLQQPIGMAVFIGVPVCAFIIIDIIRRSRSRSRETEENEQLKAELERLRAAAGESTEDGEKQ